MQLQQSNKIQHKLKLFFLFCLTKVYTGVWCTICTISSEGVLQTTTVPATSSGSAHSSIFYKCISDGAHTHAKKTKTTTGSFLCLWRYPVRRYAPYVCYRHSISANKKITAANTTNSIENVHPPDPTVYSPD